MSTLRFTREAVTLLVAGFFVGACTHEEEPRLVDGRWVVVNLFDGQTAVPRDIEIELRIGRADFGPVDSQSRLERALSGISLRGVDGSTDVELEFHQGEEISRVRPVEPLEENAQYELDATMLVEDTLGYRPTPELIHFSTGSGPRVTGLWQVEDTLLVAFSEPMATDSLRLASDSVDLLWEEDDRLHSVAAERNLAEFVWDYQDLLFRVAPRPFNGSFWVKVSRTVMGASGARLDGDGDGTPGEITDDHLERVENTLPDCYSSPDRSEPCVLESEHESEYAYE